jgi:hypothetical protein
MVRHAVWGAAGVGGGPAPRPVCNQRDVTIGRPLCLVWELFLRGPYVCVHS